MFFGRASLADSASTWEVMMSWQTALGMVLLAMVLWAAWKFMICETRVTLRSQSQDIAIEKRRFSKVVSEQQWPVSRVSRLTTEAYRGDRRCVLALDDKSTVPFDKYDQKTWVFTRLLEANIKLDQYKLSIGCLKEDATAPIQLYCKNGKWKRWANDETYAAAAGFAVIALLILTALFATHRSPEQPAITALVAIVILCAIAAIIVQARKPAGAKWTRILIDPSGMQIVLELDEDDNSQQRETHHLREILNFEYSDHCGFQMLMRDGSRVQLQQKIDSKGANELRNACNEILEAYKNYESAKNVKPFNSPAHS